MIRKLPQEVIIKIAAGEVIERPFNALKQLIENSIDAESTAIHIAISDGGLSKLEIIDNGKGVHPDDFPLLCERFATSKLAAYEDLQNIGSFGFRGEALASLSYVGEMEVTSRARQNTLAYKAEFKDGKLIGQLVPLPRNVGTSIKVLNLFHNLQVRRKSLTPNEEKRKIIKLINSIALNYSNIRFQLVSEKGVQLKIGPLGDIVQSKLRLFSEVFLIDRSSVFFSETDLDSVSVSGVFSKLSVSKSKTLVLFINNRLVEYSQVFKAVERGYSTCYSSIHEHLETFNVFLSILVDPKFVDCNIHPTKKQVKMAGSQKFCQSLSIWITDIVKNNCRVKSVGKQEPIVFTQKLLQKKDQMGYNKVRMQPSQLPLKYFLTQKQVSTQNPPSLSQLKSTQLMVQQTPIPSKKQKTEHNIIKIQYQQPQLKEIPDVNTPKKQNLIDTQQIIRQLVQPNNGVVHQKKSQNQVPFFLSISQQVQNTSHSSQVKQFIKDFTYVGCYNSNYIFVQYKHSLLFLNLLPFLYPTLINHIKKTETLLIQITPEVGLCQILSQLKSQKNLDFDVEGYTSILIDNRKEIEQKFSIGINESGNIFKTSFPAQCLRHNYSSLEVGYLLARMAKLLMVSGKLQTATCEKYLVEYFVRLFKSQQQIGGRQHQIMSQFLQTKIIPLMKTRTMFPQIEVSKYFADVVDLKSLYSIFERC